LGCQVVTELAVQLPGRVGPLTLIGPTIDPDQRRAGPANRCSGGLPTLGGSRSRCSCTRPRTG
jgi:hypothetical protein